MNECGECERDLRGGHDVECSRWAHFQLEMRNWGEECSPVQCAVVEFSELMEVRRRLFHAQTQLAEADNLAEAVASIVAGDVHRTFCQGSCEICRTLAAFREVRRDGL